MKGKNLLGILMGVLCVSVARADGVANDRMGNATQLKVGQTVNAALVREWDDHRIWSEPGSDGRPIVHQGGWRDMREDNAELSDQLGGYWFYVQLQPGKDQVVALELPSGVLVNPNAANAKLNPTFTRITHDGKTYFYIRKESWQRYHTSVLDNYFRVYSGEEGSVGRELTATYTEQPIEQLVPFPGTLEQPLDLALETSGQMAIDPPLKTLKYIIGYEFWATVYKVNFKAGTAYTFWGDRTSTDMDVSVYLHDEEWGASLENFPGQVSLTWNADKSAVLRLQVVPTRDVSTKLVVFPDKHHNYGGKVTGRMLYWSVGNETPEKTTTYVGTLKARDGRTLSAFFEVDVNELSGWTNLCARVTANGRVHVLQDAGPGLLNDGNGSVFRVSSISDGKLHVDGSLVISGSGEYFFAGDLLDGAFTIAYDPGEGRGTMRDLSCQWGKVYSLDDCRFTAPSGKPRFVGWQQVPSSGVGGKFYDAKMLIYNLPHEAGKKVRFRAIWAK